MTETEIKKCASLKARRKDLRSNASSEDVLRYSINTGCDYLLKSKKVTDVFKVVLYWYDGAVTYSIGNGEYGGYDNLQEAEHRANYINARRDNAYKGVICARVRKMKIQEEEV